MTRRTGSIRDMWVIGHFVLVGIVVAFFETYLFVEILGRMKSLEIFQPVLFLITPFENIIWFFDYFAPAIFVGMLLTSLFLAHRIGAHPFYLPLSILFGLFSIYAFAMVQNLTIKIISIDPLVTVSHLLPKTTFLATHFIEIYTGAWILLVSIMYKRGNRGRRGRVASGGRHP